jgi:site-specific recombinase XerC
MPRSSRLPRPRGDASNPPAAPDPVNELHWAAFRRHLRSKNRSDLTIKSYREAFNDLLSVHDGRNVADLSKADMEEWQLAALDRLAPTTVAIRFRSLRAFYNWLVAEDEITVSPMARMSEPKGEDRPPPILDDDQLKELLKACDGKTFEARRDTAIIRLFCEAGSPRVSEMAGILLDHLDMRRDQVRVTGKGNKTRDIPIGAKTGMAFDRYLRVRARHRLAHLPSLWLGRRSAAMTASGVTQMLARRAVQAGIGHIHPHQLRHTAAHAWKDAGHSNEEAMVLFGWSSEEMPRRYGRSAATARAHRAARRASMGDRL